jgi:hypothetical protein
VNVYIVPCYGPIPGALIHDHLVLQWQAMTGEDVRPRLESLRRTIEDTAQACDVALCGPPDFYTMPDFELGRTVILASAYEASGGEDRVLFASEEDLPWLDKLQDRESEIKTGTTETPPSEASAPTSKVRSASSRTS